MSMRDIFLALLGIILLWPRGLPVLRIFGLI